MEQVMPSVQPEEKPMSGVSKIFNIFFEPRKVFESLKIKPTWLVPFLIILLLSLATTYLVYPVVKPEAIAKIQSNERIPEEQKKIIIDYMEASETPPISAVAVQVILLTLIFVVVPAILLFVGNIMLGGGSSYKKILSIFSYSYLITIPELIVKIPLILIKKTANVQTSLALFRSVDTSGTFVYKLLSNIDIFTIWKVILISMGIGVLCKFSTKKAFITVFVLWIIWILAESGFSSLFGGMFG